MRIKSLELNGFKSFVDKTRIDFKDGITAVVGPNGCGKSNVVDAMRWVMGEQSPRRLRGKGMDDVIFAGSEGRAPIGMAEVVLTFDTSDGSAPPAFQAYSEVQISRRLYRTGESEYLLNRTPCRLRDVQDFFRDISPLRRADRIKTPLLVVQGANDPRVPVAEARQIVDAVRANGVPVWYVLAANEGHGFSRSENRDYLRTVEARFLLEHLRKTRPDPATDAH